MLVNWCLEKQGAQEWLHGKICGGKYWLQTNVQNSFLDIDAIPAVLCVFEKSQQIYKKEALFQTAYYSKASMIYSKLQHIFVRM